jgi:hypothetical protein
MHTVRRLEESCRHPSPSRRVHARRLGRTVAALCAALLGASAWPAESPVGYWKVTHFDFVTNKQINVVNTCIAADGTFTEDIWTGIWVRSGNDVLLRAQTADGQHFFADEISMVSNTTMAGFDQSWTTTNLQDGFFTTEVWSRLPAACPPPAN